jgi:ribosomal protein L25 (general stress protein Ctc)
MNTQTDTSSQTPDTGLDAAQSAFEALLDREDGTPAAKKRPEPAPAAKAAEAEGPEDEPEDEEGDEPESDEDEDEGEGDDEDQEGEDDDDEPQAKVTVKLDGKDQELPLDEVVRGYQRHVDYTRKTEALAQERREFHEQEIAPVRQERQTYATLLVALEQQLKEAAAQEPNWDELWQADPIEWVRQNELKKARETKIAAAQFEQQRLQAQAAQEQEQGLTRHLQKEKQRLSELVPEASDPAKWEAMRHQIRAYAEKLGYSKEEIAQAYDSRAIAAMVKAMKYDKLMNQKKPAPDPVKAAPAVQQGRSVAPRPSTQYTKAKARLAKTGKLSDAAAVFERLI